MAIVAKAVDVDLIAEQIIVASVDLKNIDGNVTRYRGQLDAAIGAARMRRIEIGRLFSLVRPIWPKSGPNAKKWGEFLARVKIDDSTAHRYMEEFRDPEGFLSKNRAKRSESDDSSDDVRGIDGPPADRDDEPVDVLGQERDTPPFRQMTAADMVQAIGRLSPEDRKLIAKAARVNVKGGSGDEDRGTWCTSKEWALAVGPWDLDPFSNPRSHILSAVRCMLEDGGDAFCEAAPGMGVPGLYLTGNAHGVTPMTGKADELTRVWIQPPYELVAEAIAHYGHTRFCALLRWSPDVKAWFPQLWARTAVVCHPWCERMEFEPPPGVDKSGDMPFPHALYYAHEADVTDEVRARCIVWRIDHDLDDAKVPASAQLHLVR